MNCREFQNELADFIDGEVAAEAEGHLKSCAACAGLVADLKEISGQARLLAADEPSPEVWKRIENSLELEGLVRAEAPALPSPLRRSSPARVDPPGSSRRR